MAARIQLHDQAEIAVRRAEHHRKFQREESHSLAERDLAGTFTSRWLPREIRRRRRLRDK